MKESEVQAAFVKYLREREWKVTTDNPDHTDVIARQGAELLIAEIKGETQPESRGTDVDTGYGQLLRRMGGRPNGVRYALVVPDSMRSLALRVSDEVRRLLGIELWAVDGAGNVAAL